MTSTKHLDEAELHEWITTLGLSLDPDDSIQEQLRDGILLCQLVNRIKPGSVDNIKPNRTNTEAEENILRFLQACKTLGVKKIFKPHDLLDEKKDFSNVMVTLQHLYKVAADLGMGLKFTRQFSKKRLKSQRTNGSQEDGGGEEEEQDGGEDETDGKAVADVNHHVRALYAFHGSNEDELQFEKGSIIVVTKVVDGGWWEGSCDGRVGWFPESYVEAIPEGEAAADTCEKRDSAQLYYNLVVQDILDSERTYVHDITTLLSTYLVPLKTANIITPKEVDQLMGNLPDICKWQQTFFHSLEECSSLPIAQQMMGSIFLKASQEMECLYVSYCSNHPNAVAVLTENSDKLSSYMETMGATGQPGLLILTTGLSKPLRRVEKYPALLKELQRHLAEGHADAENTAAVLEKYTSICAQCQETRKKKEMEHDMLTGTVKGFNGQCLTELGDCRLVMPANQALSAEEVDERYILIFPNSFVILCVGQSLSGYELKANHYTLPLHLQANFPLAGVSIKRGEHCDTWPYPVEIHYKQETILVSLSSERDQATLISLVGESAPPKTQLSRTVSAGPAKTAAPKAAGGGAGFIRPSRAARRNHVVVQRACPWGFQSLRPVPPMSSQDLIALRDRDLKSPKSAKKFIYPKRRSRVTDEAAFPKPAVETKDGDSAILKVIEAYVNAGKASRASPKDRRSTVYPSARQAGGERESNLPPRNSAYSLGDIPQGSRKSATLPTGRHSSVTVTGRKYDSFSFLDGPEVSSENSNSDMATRLAKLEEQFGKVCNELVEVKHCLQKEVRSQVILENCLQELKNKVTPVMSPTLD
ncbi:hypothetical protein EMCRGX_G026181 [Ephydatia muelleri]